MSKNLIFRITGRHDYVQVESYDDASKLMIQKECVDKKLEYDSVSLLNC